MEKRIYNRLKTDLNTAYFNGKNMTKNLEHFRQEADSYLSGPGEFEDLSFLEICKNLEGKGKINFKKLDILKGLVETAPTCSHQMLERICKAEEDIRNCQQGDGLSTRTTIPPEPDAVTQGGAGNFHKTDNTALSYGTIQAMGKSDFNKSVGIIKIKINGQVASSGSGFRFGKNYVMTAYHVLEDIIEDVWKLAIAKVERSDQKGAIYQEIRSMFKMSSTDIKPKPKRQALPFGQLFKYLKEKDLQVEVFEEIWKNTVSIEFGVKEGKVTAGEFHFEYDIPFADRDHDVVVLQINEDIHDLLPPLVLEENVVANTVHLFGYPEGSTEIDLRSDIECAVYTDGQKLNRDVSEAIVWWRKERKRDVKNDYGVCRYGDHNHTDTGKMFLHTSKQFEKRSSGCPAVTFIKEQPVVQLMYLRGYPEFCYSKNNFPQSSKYLFEAGISMPVVKQLLLECCPQVMK